MLPLVLEEIEGGVTGDTHETAGYVTCDFCFESLVDDCCAGVPVRDFWRVTNEWGLVVCGACFPKLMEE